MCIATANKVAFVQAPVRVQQPRSSTMCANFNKVSSVSEKTALQKAAPLWWISLLRRPSLRLFSDVICPLLLLAATWCTRPKSLVTTLPIFRTMAQFLTFLQRFYGFHLTHHRIFIGSFVVFLVSNVGACCNASHCSQDWHKIISALLFQFTFSKSFDCNRGWSIKIERKVLSRLFNALCVSAMLLVFSVQVKQMVENGTSHVQWEASFLVFVGVARTSATISALIYFTNLHAFTKGKIFWVELKRTPNRPWQFQTVWVSTTTTLVIFLSFRICFQSETGKN